MRAALVFLFLVACKNPPDVIDAGADAASAPVAETAPDLATGCAEYAKAMCAAFDRCNPEGTPVLYGDVAACDKQIERECLQGEQLPGSGVTSASLHACATAVGTSACPVDRENAACASPPGKRAVGEPCVIWDQCATNYCERKVYTDACGTCGARRPPSAHASSHVAPGGHCTGDDDCRNTMWCDHGKCAKATARKLGESCSYGFARAFPTGPKPCGPGLECRGDDAKARCDARPNDGEACTLGGASCMFPATCRDGKCTPPSARACPRANPK